MSRVNEIKDKLREGNGPILYSEDELKYIQKPIGNALYKNSVEKKSIGRPRKNEEDKAKPTDRIKCKECGVVFTRCHRSSHKKTKIHKLCCSLNSKLKKILFDLNE